MIVCNGLPKTGTHALMKAVQLLGRVDTEHAHSPTGVTGQHIHICREPRNVLVSWVRFIRSEVTQGFLIGAMQEYFEEGTFHDEYMAYSHWLNDAPLSVRFEELIGDGGVTIQAVADYLQVPYLSDAYDHLPGLTVTYTGQLSNWRDHWTPEVESAWVTHGGPEIESVYGYANTYPG